MEYLDLMLRPHLIKIEHTNKENEIEAAIMGQSCYKCRDPSYDDCISCKRPTCKRHGKRVGDHFVCRDCADKYR